MRKEASENGAPAMNSIAPTRGVSLLIGDPQKAILKLSGPMIVAMMILATYNLVNAVWVAGLGPDALAAVGFVSPIYMIIIGIGSGLGAGITSSISRKIGAGDKAGADNATMHAMLFVLIVSAVLTLALMAFLEPLLLLMGAGSATALAVEYGRILFCGSVLIIFTNIAYAILRGEGDTRRTMYAMGAGSLINALLDPILIYYAKMGIAGAAYGCIISLVLVSLILIYWLFIKRDTYVSLSRRSFSPNTSVVKDILYVGLPASLEFLLYSIDGIIINSMLVIVAGTDAVAVFTAGWRVIMLAIIPMVAIGTAEISVAGASYGARRYRNLGIIHSYSTRLGLIVGIVISVFTYVMAPKIAMIFTYTADSAHLALTLVSFMHIMCLFYPFVSPGIMSASLFQGTGKGVTSLLINMLRDMILMTLLSFLLGIVLGLGEQGIWWGIVLGNILGSIVGYLWARLYVSRLGSQEDQWKSTPVV
jgi:putative MATE family efflux protein